jgi:toxin ParE1/3/4
MRELRYTLAARRDIKSITAYIAKTSANQKVAYNFVRQLRAKCQKLATLPGTLGRPRPELRPDIRSFVFRSYIIFFRYKKEALEVVNILEGHRDIESYFKDHKLSD